MAWCLVKDFFITYTIYEYLCIYDLNHELEIHKIYVKYIVTDEYTFFCFLSLILSFLPSFFLFISYLSFSCRNTLKCITNEFLFDRINTKTTAIKGLVKSKLHKWRRMFTKIL